MLHLAIRYLRILITFQLSFYFIVKVSFQKLLNKIVLHFVGHANVSGVFLILDERTWYFSTFYPRRFSSFMKDERIFVHFTSHVRYDFKVRIYLPFLTIIFSFLSFSLINWLFDWTNHASVIDKDLSDCFFLQFYYFCFYY